MRDQTPAHARLWQRVRRTLARIVAPLLARLTTTLDRSLPQTGDRAMTHPDQTRPPAPATAVRHLRFNVTEWRASATRAARDGRGSAEVAGAFLRAYGAGELDAPPGPVPVLAPVEPTRTPHPDAWHCLACRSEEVRQRADWLEAPCPSHPPTTTPTPTTEQA